MKQILLYILISVTIITVYSCKDGEGNEDVDTSQTTVIDNSEDIKEALTNIPTSTEEGLSQLDKLMDSKLGWMNIEANDGEHSTMIFTEDAEHNYSLDWNGNKYYVTSDGEWISLYNPEEMNSEDFIMPECYAVNFLSKDTFEICYVHMCARIKDEYWDTYVRIKEDSDYDIVALNKSGNPTDIDKILNEIEGKYIEVEYSDGTFRQLCTEFKIYKREAKENEKHDNFWFDHVMDGYEYHIENVSYDPMEPNKYIFEGIENYFEEIRSKLTFMLYNNYRILVVESDNKKLWYMHESDYKGIAKPIEPCDEEEY